MAPVTQAARRVLWVTNDLPPRSGGIEQFVGNLLARSDPAATRVIAPSVPDAAAADRTLPYPVRRVGRRPLLPTPALARVVRAEIASHRADVVVFGAAWPLGELAAALPVPCVALTHGHEAGLVRIGAGPLVRRALRGLAAVGVISEFTGRALTPWVAPTTTVHFVPPGVDTAAFTPDAPGDAVRRRHGLARDQPLVLCLGRMVARKGHDVLVEAWPQVRRRVPGAHLLLAGNGPLADRLRRRVATLGLQRDVTFAGSVAWTDLPAYHAAADVFAMPCRTRLAGLDVEGLGIVYLEAQACGVPVVAGRSGGAPEALVDGATGTVVDGTSSAAVAAAVVALLADPGRRAVMGAAGRAHVAARYAWPVVVRRFEAMLAAAADQPAAAVR